MTAVSRLWVAVAIAGLVATTSVPRGFYGAAAEARGGRGFSPRAHSTGSTPHPVRARARRLAGRHHAQRAAHLQPPRRPRLRVDARHRPHPGAPAARQPRHAAAGAVAGRVVHLLARCAVVHAEAAPGRHVLRRRALHLGRRRLLVPGGLRREDGQPARRRAACRRQADGRDGARCAHRRGRASRRSSAPGSASWTRCRSSRNTSWMRPSRPARCGSNGAPPRLPPTWSASGRS